MGTAFAAKKRRHLQRTLREGVHLYPRAGQDRVVYVLRAALLPRHIHLVVYAIATAMHCQCNQNRIMAN